MELQKDAHEIEFSPTDCNNYTVTYICTQSLSQSLCLTRSTINKWRVFAQIGDNNSQINDTKQMPRVE